MRIEGELKKLFLNRLYLVPSLGLDKYPPIKEIILETPINNEILVLCIKYTNMSSQREESEITIIEKTDNSWKENSYFTFIDENIISVSINDEGTQIALSALKEGIYFLNYNKENNKWISNKGWSKPLYIEDKDIFGHQILYDSQGYLLVSAPFRNVEEHSNAGRIWIYDNKNIINVIHSPLIRNDDCFGLSMKRNYSYFYNNLNNELITVGSNYLEKTLIHSSNYLPKNYNK